MNLITTLDDERLYRADIGDGAIDRHRVLLADSLKAALQKLHDLKGDGPWIAFDARIRLLTSERDAALLRAEKAEGEMCRAAAGRWNYKDPPADGSGTDCRKIVTLLQDNGWTWIGIRAWDGKRWLNNNEPENTPVLAWRDLPEIARGRWIHGELNQPKEELSASCPHKERLLEGHEPGERIADIRCPACGAELRVEYGDDEGEIGVITR